MSPLIRTANRALGLMITDIDSLDEGIPEPVGRPGVPNYAVAAEYERVCGEHLRLDGLVTQMEAGAPPAIIAIPGLPVPLSALARRATGVCHPLSVSLKTPLPDRAVRRVVLWASDLAGTDEETDAVAAVLSARGADVEVVREGRTVDAFAALYERDDIDVLWVACHGEHAPFEPEISEACGFGEANRPQVRNDRLLRSGDGRADAEVRQTPELRGGSRVTRIEDDQSSLGRLRDSKRE